MSVIIDIILVVVLAFTAFNGYRRGFIKTLFGLVGVLVALFVASSFSAQVGTVINDSFAQAAINEVIHANLSEALDDGEMEQVIGKIADYAPSEQIEEELTEIFIQKGGESIDTISKELSHKLSVPMCNAVAFILLFVLSYFAVRLSSYVLDGVFKLPILNFTNRWLGLAAGLISGVLIVMVLSRSFVCMLPWLSETYPELFGGDLLLNTVVLDFFNKYNMFSALIVGVAGIIS